MKNVLYMPANGDSIVALDIDTDDFKECGGNPYFIAGEIIKEDDGPRAYTQMLDTPFKGIYTFVDEDGLAKGLELNKRASYALYPAQIVGNVVVMMIDVRPPDMWIRDMPLGIMRKLTEYLER